ncbi:hypothetical protein [Arthrobacter oryzae]|uniref:hypothetical protein n=1 Tax=Arthrobacter oryzae TaxID=409290 RepID=UPI00273B0C1D|nr:hypothetical protein [Arthrobacter oryzae]WLQ05055.1 hypothetical protein Q8Z05_12950 [Arthrobacter oryzae]
MTGADRPTLPSRLIQATFVQKTKTELAVRTGGAQWVFIGNFIAELAAVARTDPYIRGEIAAVLDAAAEDPSRLRSRDVTYPMKVAAAERGVDIGELYVGERPEGHRIYFAEPTAETLVLALKYALKEGSDWKILQNSQILEAADVYLAWLRSMGWRPAQTATP